MALALTLARRGLGTVWPNPAVGCVIVGKGRILGRGWTQPGGRPHAERHALDQAGKAARGATAYVTLEPCAHHGQTPPCAAALVDAGIARVVTAQTDPDTRVSGRGHAILRAAGIAVTESVSEPEARALQQGFLTRTILGRPMLTLKLASSFDGRIATASGESRWITGPQARARVHALRATHDAVMVGGGTARADDPLLTVRGLGPRRQPVRLIASRLLDLPRNRLAASVPDAPLWLAHGPDAPDEARVFWQDHGAELLEIPQTTQRLNPAFLLQLLGKKGLTRIFCEGGGQFAASLLRADLVDDLIGFTAGVILGADARPGIGALGLEALAAAPRFRLAATETLGGDVLHHWTRAPLFFGPNTQP